MMPQYSMQDLERLAALKEQGGDADTFQHQIDTNTFQPPAPKADIRRDIYTVVMMLGRWVKRGEIAKELGLVKSPWLVAAIEELVDAGYLNKYVQERPNQLPVTYYEVRR